MEFSEPKFFSFSDEFTLNEYSDNKKATKDWEKTNTKKRVAEEVLETFLLLHLEQFTKIDGLQLLYRPPHPTWGGADVYAVDRFKRIHIFEIKKNKLLEHDAQQLVRYLEDKVFQNLNSFITEQIKWVKALKKETVALYFSGILTNRRINTLGFTYIKESWEKKKFEFIKEIFGENKITNASFHKRLSEEQKKEVIARILLKKNFEYEKILQLADSWLKTIIPENDEIDFILNSRKSAVIWLIGPEINKETEKKVVELRKSGVDARVLLIDMRKINRVSRWIVRIQVEKFEKREILEKNVLIEGDKLRDSKSTPEVNFNLYEVKSASQSKAKGGGNLDNPSAVIYPNEKENKPITITV